MSIQHRSEQSHREVEIHLHELQAAGFLAEDAKEDVRYMARLHSSDAYRLDWLVSTGFLYPFLMNPRSLAGQTLPAELKGFSGDLLHASTMPDTRPAQSAGMPLWDKVLRSASDLIGHPLRSGELLGAMMMLPRAGDKGEIYRQLRSRTELSEPERATSALFSFLKARSLNPLELLSRLHGYGEPERDPAHTAERFSLVVSVFASGRFGASILERWGEHPVADTDGAPATPQGLWLPEKVLFLPGEIEDFDRLLNASPTPDEQAFQEFFEAHPKWLYLLGEQYEESRSQLRLPAPVLRPALALVDGPVDRMDMFPAFLVKRIGLDLWDIVDLKRSDFRTVVGRKSRRKFSEAVADSLAQLREYQRRLNQHDVRSYLRESHGVTVCQPIAMVVIGRDSEFKTLREKSELRGNQGIRVYTYDDLRRLAAHRT
ncbi:MAG: Shedu anti-phage system protein SduA domain-containing protein, partial [Planctomycetota bacterium]